MIGRGTKGTKNKPVTADEVVSLPQQGRHALLSAQPSSSQQDLGYELLRSRNTTRALPKELAIAHTITNKPHTTFCPSRTRSCIAAHCLGTWWQQDRCNYHAFGSSVAHAQTEIRHVCITNSFTYMLANDCFALFVFAVQAHTLCH